tara:strand:+ start:1940 stop:2500 length:561 start_codon:yes stop_codon:yes gene_type:complete
MPIYKDNALNRCLKRVGKSWGGGKGKAVGAKSKPKGKQPPIKLKIPKSRMFSTDVSDVKDKAPTIKKGTKITPKFGDSNTKIRKGKAEPKKRGRGVGFGRTKMVGKSAPHYDKGEKAVAGRGNTKRSGRGQKGLEKGGLVSKYMRNKGLVSSFKPTLGSINERMRKERSDKGKKRGKKGVMKYEHL